MGKPVILVPKPTDRSVFANELSFRNPYPIPRIDECLESLGDASLFTTLETNSGFWQVPMAPADKEKTGLHDSCRLVRIQSDAVRVDKCSANLPTCPRHSTRAQQMENLPRLY